MDPLYRARARAHVGDLPPELMAQWAALALTRGYDSPTLRELAGAHDDAPTLRDLLTAALDELGAPRLNDHQALWIMAHTHARAIVEGLISPEEGAELLWHIARDLGYPDQLAFFVNEATDWDYAWELDQDQSRRDIIEEAGTLLATLTNQTLDQQPAPDRLPVFRYQMQDPPTTG